MDRPHGSGQSVLNGNNIVLSAVPGRAIQEQRYAKSAYKIRDCRSTDIDASIWGTLTASNGACGVGITASMPLPPHFFRQESTDGKSTSCPQKHSTALALSPMSPPLPLQRQCVHARRRQEAPDLPSAPRRAQSCGPSFARSPHPTRPTRSDATPSVAAA